MKPIFQWMLMSAVFSAAAITLSAAELPLTAEQVEPRYKASAVLEKDGAIILKSDTAEWDAGVRINPPKGGKFDFSNARYLAVDVENLSKDRQLRLTMHISSGGRERRVPATSICRCARSTPASG